MAGKNNETSPLLQDVENLPSISIPALPEYNPEVKNLHEMTEQQLAKLRYEIESKENFFIAQLEQRGISFFINGSGFIDGIGIFQESIGVDILSVIEKHIILEPFQGFIVQKAGNKLGIFDANTGEGLLIYDRETQQYYRFESQTTINIQNVLPLGEVDFEFDGANHFE